MVPVEDNKVEWCEGGEPSERCLGNKHVGFCDWLGVVGGGQWKWEYNAKTKDTKMTFRFKAIVDTFIQQKREAKTKKQI